MQGGATNTPPRPTLPQRKDLPTPPNGNGNNNNPRESSTTSRDIPATPGRDFPSSSGNDSPHGPPPQAIRKDLHSVTTPGRDLPSAVPLDSPHGVPPLPHAEHRTERSPTQSAKPLRDYVLQEILTTERTYVQNLDTLVRTFVQPLRDAHHTPTQPPPVERERSNTTTALPTTMTNITSRKKPGVGLLRGLSAYLSTPTNTNTPATETTTHPTSPESSHNHTPLIPEDLLNNIFLNVVELLGLNKVLLEEIEARMAGYDTESTKLSDIFIRFSPYLKKYVYYAQRSEQSQELLTATEQPGTPNYNKSFTDYARNWEQQLESNANDYPGGAGIAGGGTIRSYLIMPIQRIPRYELFFKELIKHTPETHPDKAGITECYTKICEVNKIIDRSITEAKNRLKIFHIQNSFLKSKSWLDWNSLGLTSRESTANHNGYLNPTEGPSSASGWLAGWDDTESTEGKEAKEGVDLIAPHRVFIKEGVLVKVCRSWHERRVFFLFNDLLIYGSEVNPGTSETINTGPVNSNATDTTETNTGGGAKSLVFGLSSGAILNKQKKYIFGKRFDLTTVRVDDLPDREESASDAHTENGPTNAHQSMVGSPGATPSTKGGAIKNCFKIVTPNKSFIVYAYSHKDKVEWLIAINEAISDRINKLYTYSSNAGENSALSQYLSKKNTVLLDGAEHEWMLEAPVWIPDDEVASCMICIEPFNKLTRRRHHCRACGKVVCASCSKQKVVLPNVDRGAGVRVCDKCYETMMNKIRARQKEKKETTQNKDDLEKLKDITRDRQKPPTENNTNPQQPTSPLSNSNELNTDPAIRQSSRTSSVSYTTPLPHTPTANVANNNNNGSAAHNGAHNGSTYLSPDKKIVLPAGKAGSQINGAISPRGRGSGIVNGNGGGLASSNDRVVSPRGRGTGTAGQNSTYNTNNNNGNNTTPDRVVSSVGHGNGSGIGNGSGNGSGVVAEKLVLPSSTKKSGSVVKGYPAGYTPYKTVH